MPFEVQAQAVIDAYQQRLAAATHALIVAECRIADLERALAKGAGPDAGDLTSAPEPTDN